MKLNAQKRGRSPISGVQMCLQDIRTEPPHYDDLDTDGGSHLGAARSLRERAAERLGPTAVPEIHR